MAQTTIQGSFLGDATVTGAKIGADFISAQTALTSGLATTDEIIVSDAGVIKRMDISVIEIAASQITASGTLPALNGAALTSLTAANITASGTLPALNGAALTALNGTQVTSGTLPAARIGDDSIVEGKLNVSNGPTNGHVLTARDGVAGGFTWEAAAGGGDFYDTITNGTTKVYVDNNASSGFTLNNNYKFQINMPTSGEGFFFKCADQGSEHSALFYADYPSQITKICGSSKWDVLNGGSTGSSGDGKFYVVCDANSRAIWIYNREGNNRTITVHGMGRIVSVTAQASI